MKKMAFLSMFLFISLNGAHQLSPFFGQAMAADDSPEVKRAIVQDVLITNGPKNLQRIGKIVFQVTTELDSLLDTYNFSIDRHKYLSKLNYDAYVRSQKQSNMSLLQRVLTRVEIKKPENDQLAEKINQMNNLIPYLDTVISRIESFLTRLHIITEGINRLARDKDFLDSQEISNSFYVVLRNMQADIVWYQQQQRFRPLDITIYE